MIGRTFNHFLNWWTSLMKSRYLRFGSRKKLLFSGFPVPIAGLTMKKATIRKRFGVKQIDEELIATQQKVADTFYQLKLIPKQIDVKQAMLTLEQYTALSPTN